MRSDRRASTLLRDVCYNGVKMFLKIRNKGKAVALFCVKWRYPIALLVFIFCVAFNLHGSSINEYNKLFNNYSQYEESSVVVGESRSVRSDEWLVHTPYYMSQSYNGFDRISNMMSLEGQDMIIGYNAPVVDITLIAKPFTWGYLLFGKERGLSWYWCSKMIMLLLVSFELCMILTKKNKKLSLLGMLMISFAPAVQWWFIPHAVDVFFWGMAVLVLAYHFFMSKGWWRVLWMVLLPLALITFIIALFPSLQVAVGFAMLLLFIGLMLRDKEEITFKKKDIWRIAVMVVIVLSIVGYTVIMSKDAIMALMNTTYPGSRVSLGGELRIENLFTSLVTFTLPFMDITYLNNPEVSTFIHFAPVFLMLYPIIYKKMKRDRNIIVGNILLIVLMVMIVFMLAGFPELLARVTGFSFINRMEMAYGLMATIFTIWGINMIWKKKILSHKQIWIVIAIYVFLNVCFVEASELSYLSWKWYAVIIVGLTMLVYLMLASHKRLFIVGMTLLMVFSGMTVNPIARGTAALFEHPLEQKIHEIVIEDEDAYWLAIGNEQLAAIGIANGARVLDAVNFYPDYGKWKLLDSDGEYDDIYNRYAHINTIIVGKKGVNITIVAPDAIKLEIGYEDLTEKWPVKYLVTAGALKNEEDYYKEIYKDTEGEYYIYERIEHE